MLPSAPMRRWSEAVRAVAATRRTSEKVSLLADYLRSLGPDELPIAVAFLAARPSAGVAGETLGLGWAAIARAAVAVAGTDATSLRRQYDASSDLSHAIHDLFQEAGHGRDEPGPSLAETRAALTDIAAARGPEAKAVLFEALLRRSDPDVAGALAKIVGGEMRIGLREGLLEAAIAAAFGRDPEAVRWASMLTGDPAAVAVLARDDQLASARLILFRPLTSMLASPAADAAEVFARLGAPVWVEDKYDGIRAQLHRQGTEVRLFSRDLHDISAAFPEVIAAAAELGGDGIIDGELLAWRDGAALPFHDLQNRLGRKRPPVTLLASTPVIFVGFDLIAWTPDRPRSAEEVDGPLLRLPLRERRSRLEGLGLAERPGLGLSRLDSAASEDELERLFRAARERGNEGLMVKDPAGPYAPGRRGYGWLKLKRPLATLDCVVVGVEVGHGKRHGVLSDYTFAVIDDRPGAARPLATVGKAYSGLTDAELAEMTVWFESHTIERFGRYRAVEPTMVVEVAFDVVQPSARHASGYALRFPRIVRLRPDKPASEADVLSAVARLAASTAARPMLEVVTAGERQVS